MGYKTNTTATKAEEQKALDQIRAIVEDLGPDSYVATAFEGCFDVAQQNIDNDWACSMAQRVESAEKKLEVAKAAQDIAMMNLETAQTVNENLKASHIERLNEMTRCLEELRAKMIPGWLKSELYKFVLEAEQQFAMAKADAAEKMAEHGDDNGHPAFKEALAAYREAREKQQWCQQLLGGLRDFVPEAD